MINRLISLFKPLPLKGLNKDIDAVIKEMDNHGSVTTLQSIVFAKSLFEMFMRQDFCLNVVLSPSGKFVLVNPYFTKMLGWNIEELRSKSFLYFVHRDDRKKTEDIWKQYLENNGKVPKFENRYKIKAGGYVLVKWQGIPPNEDGFFFTSALVSPIKSSI